MSRQAVWTLSTAHSRSEDGQLNQYKPAAVLLCGPLIDEERKDRKSAPPFTLARAVFGGCTSLPEKLAPSFDGEKKHDWR